ncbi:hypothetical protein [Bradyrhizobium tropiciagri]|uniref:hypothetical protein n=1 Tax=Bradyrhizobium tropiciagri TaxID=312253 RepID=UPI002012F683|nr:hypothetical protein [Bradyrhizobium tropiciagri]
MIDVMAIKVGTRLKLEAGIVAEVVENMDDGQWLQVRYLECPSRPDDVGTVELCHAQDVIKVLGE